MKRILLSLLTFGLCLHMMANNDVHLKRLVKCVNDSNYIRATKELPKVKDWSYEKFDKIPYVEIENALTYADYLTSINVSKALQDSFLLYVEKYATQFADDFLEIGFVGVAIDKYEQIATIRKKVAGERDAGYANALYTLGNLYEAKKDYAQAEQYYLQANKVQKNILKKNNLEYALSLNDLGVQYYKKGDYAQAENYFLQALNLRENHPDYAMSLHNLGSLYQAMGDYAQAEQYYLQALEIQNNTHGENHPNYATSLNNLGSLYHAMGDYAQAEQYYLRTLEIRENLLGKNHPDYATSLNNLGSLYSYMGNYAAAEKNFLQAIEIRKNIHGENHPNYANFINNLGFAYYNMGKYAEAEKYLLQGLEFKRDIFGENHSEYASSLNNLGGLYDYIGEYAKAEQYLIRALEIRKNIFGENHPKYASSLNNLGGLYDHIGEYAKAEQYYLQTLEIRKNILGELHPDYASSLSNLGVLYNQIGDFIKAEPYYAIESKIRRNMFLESLNYLTETQRKTYWNMMKYSYELTYPWFVYCYHYQNPSISTFAYDNELFTKGLLLNSSNAVTQSILESNDTTLIAQWNDLTTKKQQIIVLEQNDPQSEYIAQLRDEAEVLEKEITKSSAAYRENIRQWTITWDSVRNVLKPNQVAIEYMSAPLTDDSTMYCALLVRDTCTYPILIPLFNEPDVAGLLHTSTEDAAKINTTYLYDRNGKQLSQYIWSSVTPYIKPGEEVFFSPTGVLHQIAIENLPYDSTQIYGDVYSLVRLSSTRELVLNKPAAPREKAVLYGGILYEPMMANKMLANAQRFRGMETELVVSMANDTTQRSLAGYLSGTKKEIDAIKPILENSHISVTVYSRDTACEESFKALSGTKQNVLHLATHGFFWQDKEARKEQYFKREMMQLDDEKPIVTIDPLNRCGLLFAGANSALSGHFERLPKGVDDGILTAKEISVLDFRSTDIVVMSACETGLGDISGEGVFGLQRAFKMAGAQTILMTLWRVNDAATQLFMTSFFRHLNGHTKREAFRMAQQDVRNYEEIEERSSKGHSSTKDKYKNKGKNVTPQDETEEPVIETIVTHPYQSPYYWAGFILLD